MPPLTHLLFLFFWRQSQTKWGSNKTALRLHRFVHINVIKCCTPQIQETLRLWDMRQKGSDKRGQTMLTFYYKKRYKNIKSNK